MAMGDDAERTLYCGNLDNRVTEEMLYELFLQVKKDCIITSFSYAGFS